MKPLHLIILVSAATLFLFFVPIPSFLKSNAQCKPCDPSLPPGKCGRCPQAGDLVWHPPLAFQLITKIKSTLYIRPGSTDAKRPHDRCLLKPVAGPCEAIFYKYYFDINQNSCQKFIWGGCQGVVPFQTLADCQAACE